MKLSFIDTIHRLRPRRFPVSREEEGVFKRVIVGNINSRRSVGDAYQHPPETTILSFSRVRKVRAQRGPCYVPDISFFFFNSFARATTTCSFPFYLSFISSLIFFFESWTNERNTNCKKWLIYLHEWCLRGEESNLSIKRYVYRCIDFFTNVTNIGETLEGEVKIKIGINYGGEDEQTCDSLEAS